MQEIIRCKLKWRDKKHFADNALNCSFSTLKDVTNYILFDVMELYNFDLME